MGEDGKLLRFWTGNYHVASPLCVMNISVLLKLVAFMALCLILHGAVPSAAAPLLRRSRRVVSCKTVAGTFNCSQKLEILWVKLTSATNMGFSELAKRDNSHDNRCPTVPPDC